MRLFSIIFLFELISSIAQAQPKHENNLHTKSESRNERFSSSIERLPTVLDTIIVPLKDQDNFLLKAYPVRQKINGTWVRRLSYNGMIPGPIFKVQKGSRVNITLLNQLELDTTLHSHGLRVPTAFDGVPGLGQPPIKPGESYRYELEFKDEGLFWYHPHIRDDYTIHSGLYGTFLVEGETINSRNQTHEIFLTLNDYSTLANAQHFYKNKAVQTLMGRYGQKPLINGKPPGKEPLLIAHPNERIRFYVLNAANARPFRIAIPNQTLDLISSDGGIYSPITATSAITLGPSERYVFDVVFKSEGVFQILNAKPDHPWTLGHVKVIRDRDKTSKKILDSTTPLPPGVDWAAVQKMSDQKPDFNLKLSLTMDHDQISMDQPHGKSPIKPKDIIETTFYDQGRLTGVEWDDEMKSMNLKSNNKNVEWQMIDTVTNKSNMNILWTMKKNQLYKIQIFNDPNSMHPMQHPIHFHGQQFAILNVNGKTNPRLVWKDTALIGVGDTVDLILNPQMIGSWMAHCHILEHIESNMMMGFNVTN